MVYDSFGNRTSTKVGNSELSENVYDNRNGVLLRTEYGNGDTTSFTYNTLGLVKDISYNGTQKFSWEYTSTGGVVSHTDNVNNRKYLYDYDTVGRLIRQEIRTADGSSHVGSSEFAYDVRNNVTKIANEFGGYTAVDEYLYSADSGNANAETYAKDNLISRYKIANSSGYVDYTYDSLNRLKKKTLTASGTTLSTEYFYKPSQRNSVEGTTKYTTTQLGREIVDNTAFTYYYDSVGNITKVLRSYKNQGVDNTADYKSYKYDTENQLIREDNKEDNKTFVFDYDDLGNISSKTIYNYTSQNVTPTSATSTVTYRYGKNGPNGWNHLLTGVDSDGVDGFGDNETITYDEIGNPEKYLGADLTWYGRQLQSYTKDGAFTYTYDTDGLRATKVANDVNYTYHYLGGQLRYETRGAEKFYYFYDASGVISGFRYVNANGTTALYYTLTNAQGDVIAIYDQNGALVGSYEYDAWGNVLKMTDGSGNVVDEDNTTEIVSINAIRYRGYYYDEETDFYYLQSRYYNPEVGRFLNADGYVTTGQGVLSYNMFAYCGNNPVNRADPTGEFWDTIFDAVSLCVSVVDVIKAPSDAMAWVGLAADIVSLVVPFATGGGTIVKAATKADDVVDAVKTVNKVDDVVDTTKTANKAVKVHGNSLKSTKTNYGYVLLDGDNNIMKFGETVNPKTRYSQKYLNQNGYSMKILESGSKADIHYWQYDMNMYYRSCYGSFPPLNKRGW